MEARCQCGTIKFVTPLPAPVVIYICHCTECRHQASSAYGITCSFPDFEIAEPHPGAIKTYKRPNSVGHTVCHFCTTCGARLVHKSVDKTTGKTSELISVKGGCIDGLTKEMMDKAIHIWTDEAIVDFPKEGSWPSEPEGGSFEGGGKAE